MATTTSTQEVAMATVEAGSALSQAIAWPRGWSMVPRSPTSPLHNVHFVKYDVTVSFDDAVSDTIRRRGGNRGIFTEEGVDTVAYFGGNHGSRV